MKLYKNASGKTLLKLTKSEWLAMGKQGQWAPPEQGLITQDVDRVLQDANMALQRLESIKSAMPPEWFTKIGEDPREWTEGSKCRYTAGAVQSDLNAIINGLEKLKASM